MTKRQLSSAQKPTDQACDTAKDSPAPEEASETSNKRQRAVQSDFSSDESVIINLTSQQKPQFNLSSIRGSDSLRNRLQTFLPELANANAELKGDGRQNLEDVEEDGTYISMDLGLGVLEDAGSSSQSSSDDEDQHSETSAEQGEQAESETTPRHEREDVMLKLMGKDKAVKSKIQEVTTSGG